MKTYVLHGHHGTLLSTYASREEAEERVWVIRSGLKGPKETPIRMRLIHVLSDEETQEPEVRAWVKARAVNFIRAAAVPAAAFAAARADRIVACAAADRALILWHRRVCGCEEWNEKRGELVFSEASA